jgi:trk system potassium uptake protein TrkH
MLYLSLAVSLLVLFHLGYNNHPDTARIIDDWIQFAYYFLGGLVLIRTVLSIYVFKEIKIVHYGSILLIGYISLVAIAQNTTWDLIPFLDHSEALYLGIFLLLLTELSKSSLFFDTFYFNPTLLFVCSFLGLILLGAILLVLPKTVHGPPLRFVDALFMATSAVCITGLSVIDTATQLTDFGKTILLILIQLGALGIMTFTGFFGYFFSGGFSYKNQLMFGEIIGQNKVGSVVNTLLKIIFVTLFFELIGAVFLFVSVPSEQFDGMADHLFFALFHAVSAFCNAGFSIVEGGLRQVDYRFNYEMQLVLTGLFILGGLGFTMVFNFYTLLKRWFYNLYRRLFYGERFRHKAWVVTFNNRLIAWSSLFLILFATLATLIFEYDGALAEHPSWYGKLTTALFTGNSSRTSGFNTIDMEQVSLPFTMIIMLLMWIGASPGSTGGGIKNTTFAIALLNIASLARGRDHLELFHRKVSDDSVNKAFAIIMLSLVAIGICICLLTVTDSRHGLKALAFEAFSAYATCGLSLGITPFLSDGGKVVLICTMFIGRVGMLTLLVTLIKNLKNRTYSYPEEKVLY